MMAMTDYFAVFVEKAVYIGKDHFFTSFNNIIS